MEILLLDSFHTLLGNTTIFAIFWEKWRVYFLKKSQASPLWQYIVLHNHWSSWSFLLNLSMDAKCFWKVRFQQQMINYCSLSFNGFLIALSNAWGLFLIIIFLGYGLVTVPKHCFKMTSIDRMYEFAMFRVA